MKRRAFIVLFGKDTNLADRYVEIPAFDIHDARCEAFRHYGFYWTRVLEKNTAEANELVYGQGYYRAPLGVEAQRVKRE